jgi:hypothetical protein
MVINCFKNRASIVDQSIGKTLECIEKKLFWKWKVVKEDI